MNFLTEHSLKLEHSNPPILIDYQSALLRQVGRINFDAQLDNFANTKEYIISTIGAPMTMKLLQTALFSVTMGSNDFINNYLVPVVSKVQQNLVSPETFVADLITRYRTQLTVGLPFANSNSICLSYCRC